MHPTKTLGLRNCRFGKDGDISSACISIATGNKKQDLCDNMLGGRLWRLKRLEPQAIMDVSGVQEGH
jgi:hypothetical protein